MPACCNKGSESFSTLWTFNLRSSSDSDCNFNNLLFTKCKNMTSLLHSNELMWARGRFWQRRKGRVNKWKNKWAFTLRVRRSWEDKNPFLTNVPYVYVSNGEKFGIFPMLKLPCNPSSPQTKNIQVSSLFFILITSDSAKGSVLRATNPDVTLLNNLSMQITRQQ